MKDNSQIVQLGDEVSDNITGFSGIAVSEIDQLHGITRYIVQPPINKDGAIPDANEIDVTSLKVVSKDKVAVVPPIKVNDIVLGDEAMDPVTGMKGIVIVSSLSINGCTRVALQPKLDKDGKFQKSGFFHIGQLKKLEAAKVSQGQRSTGGPMTRVQKDRSGF